MLAKPVSCLGCPMYQEGRGFCPDDLPTDETSTLVLMQNPGANEENEGRPAIGKSGAFLSNGLLRDAGLHRGSDTMVGNVVKCRWRHSNDLPPEPILSRAVSHCMAAHLRVPETVRVIAAVGDLAWKATGQQGSITAWRGYRGDVRFRDRPVVGLLHPAYVLDKAYYMMLPSRCDWRRVVEYREGRLPIPDLPHKVTTDLVEFELALQTLADPLVIDTEYSVDTNIAYLTGVTSSTGGVQLSSNGEPLLAPSLFRGRHVVFQNAAADIPVLKKTFGVEWQSFKRIDDIMLMHAVLWSELPHDLEFIASLYSPYAKKKHLGKTDVVTYNWGDCQDTYAAFIALDEELHRDQQSRTIYEEQSLGLLPLILQREERGLKVNQERVATARGMLKAEAEAAQHIAIAHAGWPINLGSPKQVGIQLFDIEGLTAKERSINKDNLMLMREKFLPVDKEYEERNPITTAVALERIDLGAHPLIEARTVFVEHGHMLSHYIEPLAGKERCYPGFHIHAQESGRWSIVDPPLSQLPDSVSDIIMPDEGMAWIGWDWDQIELRLMALFAKDEALLRAFREGLDVHTLNACDIFSLPYPPNQKDPHYSAESAEWRAEHQWVGKDDIRRKFAKIYVYRLSYGGKPETAPSIPGADKIGLRPQELIEKSRLYLHRHRAIQIYQNNIRSSALTVHNPMIRTWDGRLRRFLRSRGEKMVREMLNQPMQGGVVGVLNKTLLRVHRELPDALFAFTCHDEAWIEVPAAQEAHSVVTIRSILDTPWTIAGQQVVLPATIKKVVRG